VRDGDRWTEQAKLTPEDPAGGQRFGDDVSIDGNIAIVAAPLDAEVAKQSGAAYIFVNDGGCGNNR
jgi:hypothetical protein